jgi:hypothetical protein
VREKWADPCDEPGAATGPVLGGPVWKGLLKKVAVGVWALNAGEGWMVGDVAVERVDDGASE